MKSEKPKAYSYDNCIKYSGCFPKGMAVLHFHKYPKYNEKFCQKQRQNKLEWQLEMR
jgi:hypothetical protein